MRTGRRQEGFTLVIALMALFFLAIALERVMTFASQQAQREREMRLLEVGRAYAAAIGTYYESSPGSARQWPRELEELIEDRRFVGTRRHLRERYEDPMARSGDWGVVLDQGGGIRGVYSQFEGKPILIGEAAMPATMASDFTPPERYADWKFIYQPMLLGSQP